MKLPSRRFLSTKYLELAKEAANFGLMVASDREVWIKEH